MGKDYLISIDGTMLQDGESDNVRLLTRGRFVKRGANFFITYNETEATGYEGSTTTVKVEEGQRVSMTRFGKTHSKLIIERGRRHVCHYESGYGSLSLGISADEIINNLTDQGGDVTFSYTLDSGNVQISHNQVKITVQEKS